MNDLDGGLDALEHPQADDGPGGQQAAHDVRVEGPHLVDGVGDVQRSAVPEERRRGTRLAFLLWTQNKRLTFRKQAAPRDLGRRVFLPVTFPCLGHCCQGNGYWKELPR